MIRNLVFVLVAAMAFSCSTEKALENARIDEYFDLKGTLDSVVEDMLASGAKLKKQTTMGEEVETVTLELKTKEDWERQFELFYEADINKVGMSGLYQMETLQAFDGIEKQIYAATKKSAFVKSIECAYRDGKLFTIRIIASDKNFVYGAAREYILHFNHFKSKMRLDHYSISSAEQMLFKGELDIQVVADVVID